ncbi:hypothetical protein NMG60_11032652 [Bertholletia excelsa]
MGFSPSLSWGKPVLSGARVGDHGHRPPRFLSISCKAARGGGETEATNFYELLSLSSESVGVDEIKRAYRAKALKYHPDVCDPSAKEESAKIFLELHAAYKTLSDPVLGKEYYQKLNLSHSKRTHMLSNDRLARKRWKNQILELRKRSSDRAIQKDGTWGSRQRARKRKTEDARWFC